MGGRKLEMRSDPEIARMMELFAKSKSELGIDAAIDKTVQGPTRVPLHKMRAKQKRHAPYYVSKNSSKARLKI